VFVFDTSAFLNGARHHYFFDTMPGVWALVEETIDDGRVIVPREVYRELFDQDDDITALVKRHEAMVVEPSEGVQRRAGEFQQMFPKPGLRDGADPFIMAEAEDRAVAVVTYEGITFAGDPAKKADEKLPALCAGVGIDCCTLAQALRRLGLNL
jgi:hypothetical protein